MADLLARHVEWVAARVGRDLTAAETALVRILSKAVDNPWNIHRDWSIMRSAGNGYASITLAHDLATVDCSRLTALVFAAHDECCRVSVGPGGPWRSRGEVWPRVREGDWSRRHPTLEAAVTSWRADRWEVFAEEDRADPKPTSNAPARSFDDE